MTQWTALPQIPFTYEYCRTIPKVDQIGKKDAYRLLLQAPVGPLPITEDAPFKWWLFVCNLGKITQEVIGPGLTAATLEHKSQKRHTPPFHTRRRHKYATFSVSERHQNSVSFVHAVLLQSTHTER